MFINLEMIFGPWFYSLTKLVQHRPPQGTLSSSYTCRLLCAVAMNDTNTNNIATNTMKPVTEYTEICIGLKLHGKKWETLVSFDSLVSFLKILKEEDLKL